LANPNNPADIEHMQAALLLAARGLGRVAPNPAVGCVIVSAAGVDAAGHVVGRGFTQPGGRPHAETEALRMAGNAARGATAYVTLEPCSHTGKTPACADALIAAGIARVVIALEDPDPRVNGSGVRRLREAGIGVDVGLCAAEAADLNAGFFIRVKLGRPLVTLKLATSLDGRIAAHNGDSRWITGEAARARGHLLRATHDAILVGSGTALADDPELTCRLPGLGDRSPARVVLDSRLRLPLTSRLVESAAKSATYLATVPGHPAASLAKFRERGVTVLEIESDGEGRPALSELLKALGSAGVTRLLVEGGAQVAAAFVKADLVDRLAWFRAPGLIGGDGLASIAEIGLDSVARMARFERLSLQEIGADVAETYRRNLNNTLN
jgi:diaminohydroxyphosphoribosylaminopyrimidine deaminase/5-amino-6-(5-phosphoribosylamino)uracil reductase